MARRTTSAFIFSEDSREQALREREDYGSIARGIRQMEAGEGRPLAEADAAMREQLRFPPRPTPSSSFPCVMQPSKT